MLLIPGNRSTNINDYKEYSELDRKIIIYATSVGLETDIKHGFSLTNVSVQNGDVGGIQENRELLYTMNMYYGTIENPLFYLPNGKVDLNREAIVRIVDYGYAVKIVDKFKDISHTSNHINSMLQGFQLKYKNSEERFRDSEIVPPDPRFYNLDHQILITSDDGMYYTDAGVEIGMDMIARDGRGIGYYLRELFDEHTHVYVSKVHIDDPYKLLKRNQDLLNYINDSLCKIQNYGLLALLSSYTVIMDKELGFNILNLKRSFKKMDKNNERFEIASFFETVKECNELLKESDFNIRMTIIYNDSQTNVSVLPLINKENKLMNEQISDIKMYENMVETLVVNA